MFLDVLNFVMAVRSYLSSLEERTKKSLCCGSVAWLAGKNTEVIEFAELW